MQEDNCQDQEKRAIGTRELGFGQKLNVSLQGSILLISSGGANAKLP